MLIGVGRFGKNHLRVLAELTRQGLCSLCAVSDIRQDILDNVKARYNVKTSTNFEELLDDVDMVDVVTPASTHYKICKTCLEAGKHVLVEKPMTTRYEEALELVRIAKREGLTFMVGHIFRYNMAVRTIKELIGRGELGDIYYLFGHFMGLKSPREDVGAILNYAVHHVDIYNFILERLPSRVYCHKAHFLGREEFEDLGILVLRYPDDVLGILEVSWLPPGAYRDLTVVGSEGSIVCDLREQIIWFYRSKIVRRGDKLIAVSSGERRMVIEHEEPLLLELKDFIESVRDGRAPIADMFSALMTMKILDAALRSAEIGREVTIHYGGE